MALASILGSNDNNIFIVPTGEKRTGMNNDLGFNGQKRQYAFDWIQEHPIFWKRHYSTLLPLMRKGLHQQCHKSNQLLGMNNDF